MDFKDHSALNGRHAFLGASKYHWINYTPEKLAEVFRNAKAAQVGTELHAFAHHAIRLRIKLASEMGTLAQYVNDAIALNMLSEQILLYSDNCFGTADSIVFIDDKLNIHDYKSGIVVKGSVHQLEIYAALFCLEYNISPFAIKIELRIYQNDEVVSFSPDPEFIKYIMDKIMDFDFQIEAMKIENTEECSE
jgi:hypothetical protein